MLSGVSPERRSAERVSDLTLSFHIPSPSEWFLIRGPIPNPSLKVFNPKYISLTSLISLLPFHLRGVILKDAHSSDNQIILRPTRGTKKKKGKKLAAIECRLQWGDVRGAAAPTETPRKRLEINCGHVFNSFLSNIPAITYIWTNADSVPFKTLSQLLQARGEMAIIMMLRTIMPEVWGESIKD